MKNHKNKLQVVQTTLIQSLSAKKRCQDLLDQVRASRNAHREKVVEDVKEKNKALSNLLKAEKTKSAEINHRAWLD